MSRTPPRSRRRYSAEARAEIGQPRTCVGCDETKPVEDANYALLTNAKGGVRGWHTTCRVCQGVATAAAEGAGPVRPRGQDDLEDLVAALYTLNGPHDGPKLREVCKQLEAIVRPMGETEEGFRTFIRILRPLVANWTEPGAIHDDIIRGLVEGGDLTLIIATRMSAKSTLTSIYCAWKIFLNPLIRLMVVSRGRKLAERMLRTVRHVYIAHCPLLAHLIPNDDCIDNMEQFQVPAMVGRTVGGYTFNSLGITSNMPGWRADEIIGDDVEGPQEDTPEKVIELEEKLNELHMISPKGRKIMLGTFQSEFSIYARLGDLQDEDTGEPVWNMFRACMFEEDKLDNGKVEIHSRWPAMFSDKEARAWRARTTTRAWRLHVMLIADPSILNEKPLKISDLILLDHPPQARSGPVRVENGGEQTTEVTTWGAPKGDVWHRPRRVSAESADYMGTIAAVDPASGLAGRDAIGLAILSLTAGGQAVIRHLEGVRGATKADNFRRVASLIRDFRCTQLVVEELADGLFGETLEDELVKIGYPLGVEKVTTGGQKKGQRIIESLAPPMAMGRLVILDAVARSDHGGAFVNQMVQVSYDGRTGRARDHDDIVDALAHAVAKVKDHLISDEGGAVGEYRAAQLDNWRAISLRYGGLGGQQIDDRTGLPDPNHRVTGLVDGLSMGERLIEDDRNLERLKARRDKLNEVMLTDRAVGREMDTWIAKEIKRLTRDIDLITKVQVL